MATTRKPGRHSASSKDGQERSAAARAAVAPAQQAPTQRSGRRPSKRQGAEEPGAPAAPVDGAAAGVARRVARRNRRRERSRDEIIAAAQKVVVRDGVASTTLEAVAREVGVTKAALYYYFPSKNALLFELMYGTLEKQAHAVSEAVGEARDGGAALRAIITETIRTFAGSIDDFRIAFLHSQVASADAMQATAEQLARIRPLNDLSYAGAAKLLAEDWKGARGRAPVEPRLMAFLAGVVAIGVVTLKGAVEQTGDPLLYSDEQLIEGLSRIFEAAARP